MLAYAFSFWTLGSVVCKICSFIFVKEGGKNRTINTKELQNMRAIVLPSSSSSLNIFFKKSLSNWYYEPKILVPNNLCIIFAVQIVANCFRMSLNTFAGVVIK